MLLAWFGGDIQHPLFLILIETMEENKYIVTKIALKYVPDFKEDHRATYREVWEALMEMAKYKDNYYDAIIKNIIGMVDTKDEVINNLQKTNLV